MPFRVVVFHDGPDLLPVLARRLGPAIGIFTDPLKALSALESAEDSAILITRVQFRRFHPVGLALARLARATRPEVRVVLTGTPGDRNSSRASWDWRMRDN